MAFGQGRWLPEGAWLATEPPDRRGLSLNLAVLQAYLVQAL